jgi:hypothetical protein
MKKLLFFLLIALCSCSQYKVLAVQDFIKDKNGNWIKSGTPYQLADTPKVIHGFVWIKGHKIYGY